jgi:plasmid maintenance system antidote protein VapI
MVLEICRMTSKKKVHRGEIVENAIRQSGIPVKTVAHEIGYARQHMYNFFENKDLGIDIILQIGRAIKHDFSSEIPDLYLIDNRSTEVKEPRAEYKNQTEILKKCMQERKEFKEKYFALLEVHNALLTQKLNQKKK